MRSKRQYEYPEGKTYDDYMAVLIMLDLPDEVYRALRVRAAQHGHSIEAEVCEILTKAVKPQERIQMGEAFAALGREIRSQIKPKGSP